MVASLALVTFFPIFGFLKSIIIGDEISISTAEKPLILFIVIFGSFLLLFCLITGIGIIKKWKWAKFCLTVIFGLNIFSLLSSIPSIGIVSNPKQHVFILISLLTLSGTGFYAMQFDQSVQNYSK